MNAKLIKCSRCGEQKPPAMKHAIFCRSCTDALENAPPAPATDGDALFARIAKQEEAHRGAR